MIKFNARAREADVNYEKNFNAELDNGVYHKVEEEEKDQAPKANNGEDSLQNSFNKPSSIKSSDEEEQVDLLGDQARAAKHKVKAAKKKP